MEVTKDLSWAYLDQLITLFDYLCSHSKFFDSDGETISSVFRQSSCLKAVRSSRRTSWGVNIRPNIEFKINGDKVCGPKGVSTLAFGGVIEVLEGVIINQSLSVCLTFVPDEDISADLRNTHACTDVDSSTKEIIRRFHFDFDPEKSFDRPYSHLQYGGDFSPDHLLGNYDFKYQLFKAVDHPRIPLPPYDFILVLDMFFNQFKMDISILSQEARWKSIVMKSETLWLKSYFSKIHNLLDSDPSTRSMTLYSYLCEPVGKIYGDRDLWSA